MSEVKSELGSSAELDKIFPALCAAQAELTSVEKNEKGYGYKYSDLNAVINAVRPVLAKHGLGQIQLIGKTTDAVEITTKIIHASGQYVETVSSLPLIEMKGGNAAQAAGASISYLRRYALQAILGIASEDNDASSNVSVTTQTTPTKDTKVESAKPFRRPAKGRSSGDL